MLKLLKIHLIFNNVNFKVLVGKTSSSMNIKFYLGSLCVRVRKGLGGGRMKGVGGRGRGWRERGVRSQEGILWPHILPT